MVPIIDKVFATAFLVGVVAAIVFLFSIFAIAARDGEDTHWYTALVASAVVGMGCIVLALILALVKVWI